jgi:hypothetical protein
LNDYKQRETEEVWMDTEARAYGIDIEPDLLKEQLVAPPLKLKLPVAVKL